MSIETLMLYLSMDPNRQKKTPAWRKLLTFVLLQIVISTIFFAYVRNFMTQETVIMWLPSTIEPPRNSSLTEKEYVSRTLNPVILLWTWPFGEWFPFQKCSSVLGIPDCHITDNRSWYQKADAIIVHHRDACSSPRELPQDPRPLAQRWIWFSMESPSHSYNLSFMDNLFNLTMSYRRDSDIFTPYGWMEVLPQHQKVTVPSKSKLLAWVVSNWDPRSRRVKYYNKLKKYIKVDVYGLNHMPLPGDKHMSTLSQYKFYLAFENSIHEDYITEKLWSGSFVNEAVPIVCGPPRKNYERYMPPDSFIHIDDFPNAKKLAKFLQELDKDATRYQSYFQWRSWLKPVGVTYWNLHYCKACQYLHRTPIQYQSVPELSKWFK